MPGDELPVVPLNRSPLFLGCEPGLVPPADGGLGPVHAPPDTLSLRELPGGHHVLEAANGKLQGGGDVGLGQKFHG